MMKILLYCISSAIKIDCIYVIFFQVFDVSCFDLGGSIEPPEPLLDPPQFLVSFNCSKLTLNSTYLTLQLIARFFFGVFKLFTSLHVSSVS